MLRNGGLCGSVQAVCWWAGLQDTSSAYRILVEKLTEMLSKMRSAHRGGDASGGVRVLRPCGRLCGYHRL